MPKVPTYDSLQVASTPLRPTEITSPVLPDVAGAQTRQLAQGLSTAGGEFAKIAADAAAQVNDTRVIDAMNQAVKVRTDMQVRALQLRGRNALERPDGKALPDEFSESLEKQLQGIRDGLGNDQQRMAFAKQSGALVNQFRGALSEHMMREQRTYEDDTDKATIVTAQEQAALLWGDPAMRAQSTTVIGGAVAARAKRMGWDDKMTQAATVEAMSPMHAAVLKGMVASGLIDQADTYYKDNSAQMTLQARAISQEMLKGQASLLKAQTFADGVQSRGLNMEQALAEARSKLSGEDEERAVHEIKSRFGDRDAARAQAAREISRSAWSTLMERGSMSAVPPDMLAALRTQAPEEERQMRDWLEARARRAKADAEGKSTTGFDTYYGLRRMAMDQPDTFAGLDLRRSAPLLGKGQLEQLVDIQGSIAKGDAKGMETQRVVNSTLAMITADAKAIGIDFTPKEGSPQAKETALFLGALTSALDQATKSKGAPLTGEEAKRIGLGMLRDGIEQGSGVFGMFQTKRRGYQIATDPNIAPDANFIAAPFGKIPQAARNALVQEFVTTRGLKPGMYGTQLSSEDERAIERAYTRGVQQGRF